MRALERLVLTSLLAVLSMVPGSSLGREVAEAASPAEAKPGRATLLTSANAKGMKYFLRVPRGYDEDEGARVIVFLHGSNMNGLQYLETIDAERWCRDDILVCPNGEQGDDPQGANNFTFESAPLVAEVTKEVLAAYKATRVYLGGHSQGGFVTYSAIMLFPELFHGAFPMASDCWMQNEPNLWETKPEMLAKQKRIALAVIHGRADPVVSFSQGEHAHGIFLAMGYPKLRFFAPEKLGHQFALSPVPEALAWLDAMSGLEPEASMKLAKQWFEDEEWGWTHQAALAVLANEEADSRSTSTAKSAAAAIEKRAAEAVAAMKESLESKQAKDWLPEWFEFRRHFGATTAARELVEAYEEARMKERNRGAQLFQAAVAQRRGNDPDAMKESLERILADAPHTYHAWYALEWSAED